MPDKLLIFRIIANIEAYLNDLNTVKDITFKEFRENIMKQRFIERTIHIIIESILDITHHIISDLTLREPISYADAFTVLFENKIISEETHKNSRLMVQFRNRLVHYYEKNDPEIVYGILKKHIYEVLIFTNEIKKFMNDREKKC